MDQRATQEVITFAHIDRLQAIDTPRRLWAYSLRVAREWGFRVAIYACPPPNKKHTHPDTILRYWGMTDLEFQKFAIEGLIAQGHLTTAVNVVNAAPFRWSELGNLSKRKEEFAQLKVEANEVGIDEGWIFPVFGSGGRVGLVSYGRPKDQGLMKKEIGDRLHAFVQMSHLRFCQITPHLYDIEKPLSRREMQIIAWAAVGKSNAEISAILQISESSIDSYLRRAFAKLDVHDRTSAAVKAVSMDIIRT